MLRSLKRYGFTVNAKCSFVTLLYLGMGPQRQHLPEEPVLIMCKPESKGYFFSLVLGVRHFFKLELTAEPCVGISTLDSWFFKYESLLVVESCTSAVNPGADLRHSQIIPLHAAHKYQFFKCSIPAITPFLSKLEELSVLCVGVFLSNLASRFEV